jgi:hypothetical protein
MLISGMTTLASQITLENQYPSRIICGYFLPRERGEGARAESLGDQLPEQNSLWCVHLAAG